MHQFLATLFSLLVALCHHTSLTARPVEAAELPGTVITTSDAAARGMILPDRYHFARSTTEETSYAVSACASCRRMDLGIAER